MISKETYCKVAYNNIDRITNTDDKDTLKGFLRYYGHTVRLMNKRLKDTEHPLDAGLVSDYIFNRELSKLFGRYIRIKLKDEPYEPLSIRKQADALYKKYKEGKYNG